MFQQRDSTSINQNILFIPQKNQKCTNSSMYMATKLTPPRTSTYERPFTCKGNYLVYLLIASHNIHGLAWGPQPTAQHAHALRWPWLLATLVCLVAQTLLCMCPHCEHISFSCGLDFSKIMTFSK